MNRLACFFLIATALTAAACGTKEAARPRFAPQVAENVIRDPDDDQFMNAIQEYIQNKGGPRNSRYEFTRVDLNGDGRREGIVMLKSPHQCWCGFYGCSMAVFQAANDGFLLKSEITPVRGPLVVSESRTNGWKDIIVRVSGRTGWDAKTVALRFDGKSYPSQPAFQPALVASNDPRGIRIFP